MQFTILNRFSGEVQITAEIDCDESASHSLKLGLAVKWAVKNKANLSSADLSFLKGCKWAQVAFHSHGECGRQLSAVVIDGVTVFFCGCFKGSREQLEEYIAGGKEEFRASRTKAMQAVISLLDA